MSFFLSSAADVVGIYNTDGNYQIQDLEFEFDIGTSANTAIKTNETLDLKGVVFDRGIGILVGTPNTRTMVIFDY